MEICIGATVVGPHGKLGTVRGMIVEADAGRATDLVVRHHGLLGRTRVVPLTHVTTIEDDTVHLDLDEAGFAAMDGFVDDRHHAANRTFIPPGAGGTTFNVDAAVAGGGFAGHLGDLPGDRAWPDDTERAAVMMGTPVLDVAGERIGVVHAFGVMEAGTPSRLVLRQGHLLHHDTAIPLDWVKEIADDGVLLRVPASRVAALAREPHASAAQPAASRDATAPPAAGPEAR